MDFEDGPTAAQIGTVDGNLPVKTAGTKEGRVEDIRTVRRSNGDDAFIGTETIHFNQQLIQRLFAFIMTASETGTALAEDVTPGDYTLAVQPIEGYTQPEAQTVTVKEKVVYKADVKAVKEKIVQASQVNESAEDSGVSNAGSAPIVNEVTDTVTYADSAKTETGSKTSYTAKLSSSGHLLLSLAV